MYGQSRSIPLLLKCMLLFFNSFKLCVKYHLKNRESNLIHNQAAIKVGKI